MDAKPPVRLLFGFQASFSCQVLLVEFPAAKATATTRRVVARTGRKGKPRLGDLLGSAYLYSSRSLCWAI